MTITPDTRTRIMSLAKHVASRQGTLAISPGEHAGANSEITMCAAACVGYAGLLVTVGSRAADLFRTNLLLDETQLDSAFRRSGLASALCEKMRSENDRQHPADRLAWFVANADRIAETTA